MGSLILDLFFAISGNSPANQQKMTCVVDYQRLTHEPGYSQLLLEFHKKNIFLWTITGWCFRHYIGNNHPNCRTHIFQRGSFTTNQIKSWPWNLADFHPVTLRTGWDKDFATSDWSCHRRMRTERWTCGVVDTSRRSLFPCVYRFLLDFV